MEPGCWVHVRLRLLLPLLIVDVVVVDVANNDGRGASFDVGCENINMFLLRFREVVVFTLAVEIVVLVLVVVVAVAVVVAKGVVFVFEYRLEDK
jgi:hypothetical protein